MNKKLSILSFVINVPAGALLFVIAGIDDSPGGQLIGFFVAGVGIAGLISFYRKKSKTPTP